VSDEKNKLESSCKGAWTREVIRPASESNKTFIKSIDWLGEPGQGFNASAIDVKNGRIVRIRPLHYDWKYDTREFKPWKMEVRGKVFKPLMKTLLPPLSLSYKKRVYSPNRIQYPL
jgi:hypothetical protein